MADGTQVTSESVPTGVSVYNMLSRSILAERTAFEMAGITNYSLEFTSAGTGIYLV